MRRQSRLGKALQKDWKDKIPAWYPNMYFKVVNKIYKHPNPIKNNDLTTETKSSWKRNYRRNGWMGIYASMGIHCNIWMRWGSIGWHKRLQHKHIFKKYSENFKASFHYCGLSPPPQWHYMAEQLSGNHLFPSTISASTYKNIFKKLSTKVSKSCIIKLLVVWTITTSTWKFTC